MKLLNSNPNKVKKVKSVANSALQGGIAGGGTGALVGLLAKPMNPQFQKKAALIGTAIGAGKAAINNIKKKKK